MGIITESISKGFVRSYMKVLRTVPAMWEMPDKCSYIRVMVMPFIETENMREGPVWGVGWRGENDSSVLHTLT